MLSPVKLNSQDYITSDLNTNKNIKLWKLLKNIFMKGGKNKSGKGEPNICEVTNFSCWRQFNLFWRQKSNVPKLSLRKAFKYAKTVWNSSTRKKIRNWGSKQRIHFKYAKTVFNIFTRKRVEKCGSKQKIPRRIRIHCLTELQLNLEKYDLVGKTRKIV